MSEQDLGREIGRLRSDVDRRFATLESDVREGAGLLQGQGTILQRVDFELKAVAKAYEHINDAVHTHVLEPTGKTGLIARMRDIEPIVASTQEAVATLLDVKETVSRLGEALDAVQAARAKEAADRRERRRFGFREVIVPLLLGVVGGLMLLAAAKVLRLV